MRKRQTEHLPFIPGILSCSPHPMPHLPHQHPGPNLSSNTNASPSWKRLNGLGGGCRLQFKKELERFRVQHHPIVGTMIGAHDLFASSTPAASHAVEFGTVHGGMDICTSYIENSGKDANGLLNRLLWHMLRTSQIKVSLTDGAAVVPPVCSCIQVLETPAALKMHRQGPLSDSRNFLWPGAVILQFRGDIVEGPPSPLGPWLTRLTRDVPDADNSPLPGDERLKRSWRCSAWAR
jgi:hypothetical protein